MTTKVSRYAEYKDSGEEWLGRVPSSWDVVPIGHLSPVKRGASPRPIDDAKYFDDEGEYAWTRIADVTASDVFLTHSPQRLSELGSSLSVKLEPGELFLSIAATVGKPCITGIKTCIHDGFVYFPGLRIPNKFLFYVFAGGQAYKGLGKMGTQLNLNTETVARIKVGVGSGNELKAIVDFLDYETAKIDSLIEKQQQLIALLKEKRQAAISHAVTKGLCPDASMRDSGVEWLGEVPAHWEVMAIKRLVRVPVTDGPHETPTFIDDGVPFLSAEGVSSGVIDFNHVRGFISEALDAEYSKKYSPRKHDIFIVKSGATTGVTAIVETDRHFNIWSPLAVIRCNAATDPHFTHFFLRSRNFQEAVELNWSFGTQQNIGMGVIENLHVARPPLNEARQIVIHLSDIRAKMDAVSEKAERQVQLLQERRTALISAAVTGKIDVRRWKAPGSQIGAGVA